MGQPYRGNLARSLLIRDGRGPFRKPERADWADFIGGRPSQPNPPPSPAGS
jgi:hypothetical protein